MWLEELMIFIVVVLCILLIGIPLYKLAKLLRSPKKDPVKEAKIRLQTAQQALEAAKIEKEAEKIYTEMYSDVLNDDSYKNKESK